MSSKMAKVLLKALEFIHGYLEGTGNEYSEAINEDIEDLLDKSEIDLGIIFKDGKFYPSGAKILDEKLINENLDWIINLNYDSIYEPFNKALQHLLNARNQPELLSDVVTDMYEALESAVKIYLGNNRDLSGNREKFISEINVSVDYKKILKEYISFANNFRHGTGEGDKKPNLSYYEVESFVYLTGLFIRLALETHSKK